MKKQEEIVKKLENRRVDSIIDSELCSILNVKADDLRRIRIWDNWKNNLGSHTSVKDFFDYDGDVKRKSRG
jgi:hypothetical protein